MKGLRRTLVVGTMLLEACAPMKAEALPKSARPDIISPSRFPYDKEPIRKIKDGNSTYCLLGSDLRVSSEGITKSMDLTRIFSEAKITPSNAQLRMDNFPPTMNFAKKLLYLFSPGADGIVVLNPRTGERFVIDVSDVGIRNLTSIVFSVKNGIIAVSGEKADFIVVVGLGDLTEKEIYPKKIYLGLPLAMRGRQHLNGPRIDIRGNRVYLSDEALGKEAVYFLVGPDRRPLPITFRAEE